MSTALCSDPGDQNRTPSFNVLTQDQLRQLLAAAQNDPSMQDLHDVVTIVSNTGIRAGELMQLRWSDVDLDNRQLVVHEKTSNTRTVPFEAESHKAFEALHARRPGSVLLLGDSPSRAQNRLSRQLRALSGQIGMRNVTFQVLRHTFLTRLASAGAPAFVIMAIGGWTSASSCLARVMKMVGQPEVGREYAAAMDALQHTEKASGDVHCGEVSLSIMQQSEGE